MLPCNILLLFLLVDFIFAAVNRWLTKFAVVLGLNFGVNLRTERLKLISDVLT